MFSYVFMKLLERRPRSYDRAMDVASSGRTRRMKRAVVAAVESGSHVLEIGCGSGELAALLVRAGCTVEGFDRNRAMVAAAREALWRHQDDRYHMSCYGCHARHRPSDSQCVGRVVRHSDYSWP